LQVMLKNLQQLGFFHLVHKEIHPHAPFKKLRKKNKFIKNTLSF